MNNTKHRFIALVLWPAVFVLVTAIFLGISTGKLLDIAFMIFAMYVATAVIDAIA